MFFERHEGGERAILPGAQRLDCVFLGGGAARFGGGRGGNPNVISQNNDAQKWLLGGLNQVNNGP